MQWIIRSTVLLRYFGAIILGLALLPGAVVAGESKQPPRVVKGERYTPAIWIDPDGCEHWVMDDGWEGYMTPNVTRDGRPVCHSGNTCASLNSDQLFGANGHRVGAQNRARLTDFFQTADAKAFIITGHTDSHASDAYNLRLSRRRAQAVARIAVDAGADVFNVHGYGERAPKATNSTAAGRRENRRVEIICVH